MRRRRAHQRRSGALSLIPVAMVWAILFGMSSAVAQPVSFTDADGDALMRRTDPGNDGPLNQLNHRLPDIVQMRLGKYAPYIPWADRFAGEWLSSGDYVRFDVVFSGLINPPGPVGFDDEFPTYDPFAYGASPVYGFIEFDVDADENTGGELEHPQFRYLANAGRFGGIPDEPRFAERAVLMGSTLDGDFSTAPFAERSGEEFHLALLGEEMQTRTIIIEKSGGDPAVFEAGETWDLTGNFFHRAHGFEDFAFKCILRPGPYTPQTKIRFSHDVATNRTTVSLVYSLTNAACAQFSGTNYTPGPNDGCDNNHNSIEEALYDLQFSAMYADPYKKSMPEFQLIEGWQFCNMSEAMDPANWRVCALVGSAYEVLQPWGARFVWTDIYPNVRAGDFNGDGLVNGEDVFSLLDYVSKHDGEAGFDEDKIATNKVIDIIDFGPNFCAYDTGYDGVVNQADRVVLGDKNLDQILEVSDVADFVQGLLQPQVYTNSHSGISPQSRGDVNGDGVLDGRDIGGFVQLLVNP